MLNFDDKLDPIHVSWGILLPLQCSGFAPLLIDVYKLARVLSAAIVPSV